MVLVEFNKHHVIFWYDCTSLPGVLLLPDKHLRMHRNQYTHQDQSHKEILQILLPQDIRQYKYHILYNHL